jgi:hypothetical protein
MPEKSVIQMTAERHASALVDILAAHEQMSAATGAVPAGPEHIDLYCRAYAEGWKMATYFILSRGNSKFEREDGNG